MFYGTPSASCTFKVEEFGKLMYTCYRSSAVNHLLQKFLYDIYCYLDVLLLQHSTCMVDTFIDE